MNHMTCSDTELVQQLKEIKGLLATGGKVFMRTHPYCSRHGTHLYHEINKAYIQMVFTNEELESMGYKQEPIRKVFNPIQYYDNILSKANFKIHSGPHQIKEGVESFLTQSPIIDKIKSNYTDKFSITFLENQFIDYILI